MAEETPNATDQAEEIQKQINQALKELDQIRNQQQSITTPAELQAPALVQLNRCCMWLKTHNNTGHS